MKKKLLIVDDIEEYLEAVEGLLSPKYEVVKARNLEESINTLKKEKIDLAIIDIRLKEDDPSNRDGLKVVKWIKENSPHTIPIVMSAYKEFDYAVEALNLGARYFLKKPLKPEEIEKVLNELLK